MSASSRSRSSASAAQLKSGFQQSASPASRFYSSTFSSPAANPSVNVFATSSSSFAARSTSSLFTRSSSPTRVNLIRSSPSAPSPSRSISAVNSDPIVRPPVTASVRRKTCMCSPTTHPGSFRCSFHKAQSNRPRLKRAAMTNSLVRIGTVEGEIVKRSLAALIRPSSHQQRRRCDFRPRPSRLSKMFMADDL
ncbi:hypothetical protein KSP39_PZI018255 [Platanthera zijinensis]|uniref:Serine-rich protein-like protein n=1 Tax=Platanthera zijinensis TaxID=2320716 RepID=A0AAP0FZD1_9ASPA